MNVRVIKFFHDDKLSKKNARKKKRKEFFKERERKMIFIEIAVYTLTAGLHTLHAVGRDREKRT